MNSADAKLLRFIRKSLVCDEPRIRAGDIRARRNFKCAFWRSDISARFFVCSFLFFLNSHSPSKLATQNLREFSRCAIVAPIKDSPKLTPGDGSSVLLAGRFDLKAARFQLPFLDTYHKCCCCRRLHRYFIVWFMLYSTFLFSLPFYVRYIRRR